MIDNSWIKNIIGEFEDKDLFLCKRSGIGGTRINFNPRNVSFCHEVELVTPPKEVTFISEIEDFSVEKYYKHVYDLITKFQKEEFGCRGCSQCRLNKYLFSGIKFVTICPSMKCNSKCIYCSAHTMDDSIDDGGYNPIPYLEEFDMYGCFDDNCLFDWGGGEPTLGNYFEETVDWLLSRGYRQRINTNAIDFSEAIYRALIEDGVSLRISPDSGTRDGYYRVKGIDNFETVWENISRYAGVSDEVYIKYNIFDLNSERDEVDSFISLCLMHNIKHIIIDAEISSYQRFSNWGPFYFTKKEFDMAHYLYDKAKGYGIEVSISGYSFGTRPEYDEKGTLILPLHYYDNIDRNTITNDIFLTTYSDFDNMIINISGRINKPVVLFGAGHVGYIAAERLKEKNIAFEVIDNYKSGAEWCGKRVENADDFLKQTKEQGERRIVLITANNFRKMLQQINDYEVNVEVVWLKESAYTKDLTANN